LNGDTIDTNFPWHTWATLSVWNGVEGNWKLWYLTGRLWYSHYSKDFSFVSGLPFWIETLTLRTSIGRYGQPSISGMASKEVGTCDFSLVDCDIFTIPKEFLMFLGLPTWIETLALRNSTGRHGQPRTSGTGVEGNWNLWYLTGGLWYFHNSKGAS